MIAPLVPQESSQLKSIRVGGFSTGPHSLHLSWHLQRFALPLDPILIPRPGGYLRPAARLTGWPILVTCQGRNVLYPVSLFGVRCFPRFFGRSVSYSISWPAAGRLFLLTWRVSRVFVPTRLASLPFRMLSAWAHRDLSSRQ